MIRWLLVIGALALIARLRYERARWTTGCGRHRATAAGRPHRVVPLLSLCDLPKAGPWPGSAPQRPSGAAWDDLSPFRAPAYVMTDGPAALAALRWRSWTARAAA